MTCTNVVGRFLYEQWGGEHRHRSRGRGFSTVGSRPEISPPNPRMSWCLFITTAPSAESQSCNEMGGFEERFIKRRQLIVRGCVSNSCQPTESA